MASRYAISKTLRVVGQVLQRRGLDLFDLKYVDDKFHLQCGGAVPPYLDLVEFSLSPAEIRALDLEARANRDDSFKMVNFGSLPEVFRAIGRRIDDREGQLLRVSNSDVPALEGLITIEYQTRDTRRHVEEISTRAFGGDVMRMYKKRSRRLSN